MSRASAVGIAIALAGAWTAGAERDAEAAPRKPKATKAAKPKVERAPAPGGPDLAAMERSAKAAAERVAQRPRAPRPAVIYLNGDGAPILGSRIDDPSQNRASALDEHRRVAVPPFAGTPEAWAQVVACVKKGFAPFAVDIVTERPPGKDYSMVVVGGSPSLVHGADTMGGFAPMGDGFDRELIAFVFSDALRDDVAKVCQGVLHESGHLLGLDHVYACEDPMSYLSCGEQRFSPAEEPCGEREPRACKYPRGTAPAQSSARLLGRYVGWRGGEPPVPEAPGPPAHHALPVVATLEGVVDQGEVTPDGGERPTALSTDEENAVAAAARADAARAVRIARKAAATASASLEVRAHREQRGHAMIELVVEARSDRHIQDAALRWSNPSEEITFGCGELALTRNPDATCRRQGNVFVFHIRAGVGQRGVRALAPNDQDLWLISSQAVLSLVP